MNHHSYSTKKYYPILIGAALLATSLFRFSLPALSAGTAAGETIRNTATGTYRDDAGNDYTIDSNTVEVTVAKVAGITNQPSGFSDLTPGNNALLTGDRVSFEFEITNVGNDVTDIYVPGLGSIATRGLSTVTGSNNNADNLILQVSPALNADQNFSFGNIPNTGGPTAVPERRPNGGLVRNVPVNGRVIVRVTGTVSATAAGTFIEVLLGDTPPNADPNAPVAATQNQPDAQADNNDSTDDQAEDVRTQVGTATGGTNAAFLGGEREASALQQQVLGSVPLAMTRIEKVRGDVVTGATLQDNVIPYRLDLEVLTTTPSSLFTPGDLEGRDYGGRIDGIADTADNNLILVSDRIPAGTVLNALPTSPNNWIPVYSTDSTTAPADEVNWTTTAPALVDVERVGWIYDVTANGNGALTAGTQINSTFADTANSTSASGFVFAVRTSGLTGDSGSVANIAQVFGSTVNGDDIFDESGDQDPTNFNGPLRGPGEGATISNGIADPNTHGIDSENNNTAVGSPGGEDNVITFGAPGTIINGPLNQAGAIGNVFDVDPADNQHDFQNLGISQQEDANGNLSDVTAVPGGSSNPGPVTFRNTFTYPLADPNAEPLNNVRIQPVPPAFGGLGGDNADLPAGTTVDIVLGGRTARYIYNAAQNNFDITQEPGVSSAIVIPNLNPDTPLNYDVIVNLPGGTPFSTNVDRGFPVPIIVFADDNNDGTPNVSNGTFTEGNVTVNQVYTGFMNLVKQVRVLTPQGNVRDGMRFGDNNNAKTPLPGDILEYRLIYRNISEPQAGNGTNGILNGVEFSIEENGTAADGPNGTATDNNWALDNNNDGDLDTIHVQNSANDTNNGVIEFFTGGPGATLADLIPAGQTDPGDTVTGYRLNLGANNSIPPAGVATNETDPEEDGNFVFTFRRTVDDFDGLVEEGLE